MHQRFLGGRDDRWTHLHPAEGGCGRVDRVAEQIGVESWPSGHLVRHPGWRCIAHDAGRPWCSEARSLYVPRRVPTLRSMLGLSLRPSSRPGSRARRATRDSRQLGSAVVLPRRWSRTHRRERCAGLRGMRTFGRGWACLRADRVQRPLTSTDIVRDLVRVVDVVVPNHRDRACSRVFSNTSRVRRKYAASADSGLLGGQQQTRTTRPGHSGHASADRETPVTR